MCTGRGTVRSVLPTPPNNALYAPLVTVKLVTDVFALEVETIYSCFHRNESCSQLNLEGILIQPPKKELGSVFHASVFLCAFSFLFFFFFFWGGGGALFFCLENFLGMATILISPLLTLLTNLNVYQQWLPRLPGKVAKIVRVVNLAS